MATSSSAKKVAKLASRGKGKKVRFSGGTTFPTVITVVCLLMLGLIVYAKASIPGEETGKPQPGDEWVASYAFRVCDEEFTLSGTPDELLKDASTGNPDTLASGEVLSDSDGIIHYHPQEGGATGRKAKLGVFLSAYGVKLNNSKLDVPEAQIGAGETHVWDVDEDPFVGTSCEGEDATIKVRVWDDYTSGSFQDFVTDFSDLRITRNGMVFVIAVVPTDQDFEIPRPASVCDLENFGAIGSGDLCGNTTDTTSVDTTNPTGSTTPTTGSSPETTAVDTTAAATTTTG